MHNKYLYRDIARRRYLCLIQFRLPCMFGKLPCMFGSSAQETRRHVAALQGGEGGRKKKSYALRCNMSQRARRCKNSDKTRNFFGLLLSETTPQVKSLKKKPSPARPLPRGGKIHVGRGGFWVRPRPDLHRRVKAIRRGVEPTTCWDEPHNLDRRPGEEAPRNTAGKGDACCMLHVAFLLRLVRVLVRDENEKEKSCAQTGRRSRDKGRAWVLGMDSGIGLGLRLTQVAQLRHRYQSGCYVPMYVSSYSPRTGKRTRG